MCSWDGQLEMLSATRIRIAHRWYLKPQRQLILSHYNKSGSWHFISSMMPSKTPRVFLFFYSAIPGILAFYPYSCFFICKMANEAQGFREKKEKKWYQWDLLSGLVPLQGSKSSLRSPQPVSIYILLVGTGSPGCPSLHEKWESKDFRSSSLYSEWQ